MGVEQSLLHPSDVPILPFQQLEVSQILSGEEDVTLVVAEEEEDEVNPGPIDGDDNYIFERITGHREGEDGIEYQVKWLGWEEETYIPAENFEEDSESLKALNQYREAVGLNKPKQKNKVPTKPPPPSNSKRKRPSEAKNVSEVQSTSSQRVYSQPASPTKKRKPKQTPGSVELEHNEYIVERILDHKEEDGEIMYLVKWLGWDEENDNTWQSREDFNDVSFVDEYQANLANAIENESSSDKDDDEEELEHKRTMGERTAKFFPSPLYRKFYTVDPKMTRTDHRFDYSRNNLVIDLTGDGEDDNSDDEIDFNESNVEVGDFVRLEWIGGKFWIARVTAVCPKGIRVVNMSLPSQTYLGSVGKLLNEDMLFQTAACECSNGWTTFKSIKRKVTVCYGDSLEPGYRYFVPFFFCVDYLHYINVPPEFSIPDATPFDLCHCPNDPDETRWPLAQKGFTAAEQMLCYMISLTIKRKWEIGKFHALMNVSFDAGQQGEKLDDVIEILKFAAETETTSPVLTVRMFKRVKGSVNELKWSKHSVELVGWDNICRVSMAECFVEYWDGETESDCTAVQYLGAGRRFFIRDKKRAQSFPARGLQQRNLKILDAFSGTGNFSKGVIDSNIGKATRAVDYWDEAVKSYNAMHDGSGIAIKKCINEYLRDAARSRGPMQSLYEFDVVLASPPCQDYSMLNHFQKVNGRSMIVEVGHIIECLPRVDYLVVENVTNSTFIVHLELTGFVQRVVGLLLSFGYQIRFEVLNSGNFGSPQSRNRIIAICAAKNKVLPEFPVASHFFDNKNWHLGRFHKSPANCELGVSGAKFVYSAPCRHITVHDRIGALRKAVNLGSNPNHPLHFIFESRHRKFKTEDNIWIDERLDPNGMFYNITKNLIPGTPRYHPDEHRVLTLYERARAQGFSDRDLKKLAKVYSKENGRNLDKNDQDSLAQQIGNAVPRELAFAIGCAINLSLGDI
ncbi:UNVERIFIED_CONTAM: hypothetical protein HDU68_011166 [Siphonaria sp. JEL0065]|nr:hypothetical protein HDU68_011166 [Siphonaria sp. JEL0065]